MTVKWALFVLIQFKIIVITSPSITGVTYMDDFDFEQRFRDVNECNPFHWHPLHLPEVCADMFEKLIRSKIGSRRVVRVMVDRQTNPQANYDYQVHNRFYVTNHDLPFPIHRIESAEYDSHVYGKAMPKTDYEKMLEQLMKDIARNPSHAEIGVVPNIGPAAIYRQEVSKKSEGMIKDLATHYAQYIQNVYAKYGDLNGIPDPQVYVWDSRKNNTKEIKKKSKNYKKKDKISRTKTENNGIVTIIETINPEKQRRRRSTLYLLGLNSY